MLSVTSQLTPVLLRLSYRRGVRKPRKTGVRIEPKSVYENPRNPQTATTGGAWSASCSPCRHLGLVVGPLVALGLLEAHVGDELTWRLLLAFGALPALGVIYLRSEIPESPRFQSMVRGQAAQAAAELATFSGGSGLACGGPNKRFSRKGDSRLA